MIFIHKTILKFIKILVFRIAFFFLLAGKEIMDFQRSDFFFNYGILRIIS